MKKSAIIDIFHGFRGQIDTIYIPTENKNDEIIRSIYNELKEKLNPELFKLHEKYIKELEGEWADEIDLYFAEGFKLGLLIGIECME